MPKSFVSVSAAPRRVAAAAATLCAALALAGCASQGPAHEPLARLGASDLGLTAQSETGSNTSLPAADWWKSLGDAQLDALIAQALQGSPSLAMSRARFDKAAALATATSTATDVRGTLGVDATRQHYSANGLVAMRAIWRAAFWPSLPAQMRLA